MAVPSYETDLLPIDLAEAATAWAEPTATSWLAGGIPAADDDNPFQGSYAVSKAFNATGIGGMLANTGSAMTIPTDGAFTGWHFWAAPGSLEADASGGIRFMAGSALNVFKSWDVGGLPSYTYGGWVNYAVNPTIQEDDLVGTPSSYQYFGAAVNNTNSIFKGSPFLCDAFRYGRGEARFYGGVASTPATFEGYATENDSASTRWGLIQKIAGGYLYKGLMVLGYGSAVYFSDSNKAIFIQNSPKVTANFNTIEVRQPTSRVDWTGINITSLSLPTLPTNSKGRFIMTDNADVNFDTCAFTDMNTFLFASSATILNTTFRRCGIVTQGGATFTGCKFDQSSASVALVANAINNITDTEFISDGTGYALEGFASAGSYPLTDLTFTSYASSNGSTGNEAIHITASSGDVALVRSGGNTPTIHTQGASVTFPTSITLKMVVRDDTGNAMVGVRSYIDDINQSPYILDDTTNASGEVSVLYTGSPVANATWRVRKYGYLPFEQLVNIGSEDITLPVTLTDDPLQI